MDPLAPAGLTPSDIYGRLVTSEFLTGHRGGTDVGVCSEQHGRGGYDQYDHPMDHPQPELWQLDHASRLILYRTDRGD